MLSGGACEQKSLLVCPLFSGPRVWAWGEGSCDSPNRAFQERYESALSRGEAGIVPIFVIIKLGLELLSVGELGLGVHCTPALEVPGKVKHLCANRSCSRQTETPGFSWWRASSTHSQRLKGRSSACPRGHATRPMLRPPFSSVNPTHSLRAALLANHSSPSAGNSGEQGTYTLQPQRKDMWVGRYHPCHPRSLDGDLGRGSCPPSERDPSSLGTSQSSFIKRKKKKQYSSDL